MSPKYADLIAAAIGTAHGQYGNIEPNIRYDLIEKIGKETDIPLVIHGGSELSSHVLYKLLSYSNVKKVNISTDLKQSYRWGILQSIDRGLLNSNGFEPVRVNKLVYENVKDMVIQSLRIMEEHNK